MADNLAQIYQGHGCKGIASFIDFMAELEEDDRIRIFGTVIKQRFGLDSSEHDPLIWFVGLLKVRQGKVPFADVGIVALDRECADVALMWQETEHTLLPQ